MQAQLLPPVRQTLWGRLAVANFFLGGTGAGAYVMGAVLSGFQHSPLLIVASVLGPVLVLAGFVCVAVEAGRPLRGPFVLRKVTSSWMSRELWVGGALCVFAIADLLRPLAVLRVGAALAALLLAFAQGAILWRANGVSAWSVPVMPPLFLASALISGAGVLGLILPLVVTGNVGGALAVWMGGLILLSALVWAGYLSWPGDPAFRQATASFWTFSTVGGVYVVGHLLPLCFLLLGIWNPAFLWAALAGMLLLLGQLQAKAWLILRAGELRPITIPHLRLRGDSSSLSGTHPLSGTSDALQK